MTQLRKETKRPWLWQEEQQATTVKKEDPVPVKVKRNTVYQPRPAASKLEAELVLLQNKMIAINKELELCSYNEMMSIIDKRNALCVRISNMNQKIENTRSNKPMHGYGDHSYKEGITSQTTNTRNK